MDEVDEDEDELLSPAAADVVLPVVGVCLSRLLLRWQRCLSDFVVRVDDVAVESALSSQQQCVVVGAGWDVQVGLDRLPAIIVGEVERVERGHGSTRKERESCGKAVKR